MARIPFFIETSSEPTCCEAQICARVRSILFKNKIAPLPSASSLKEITDILESLQQINSQPAIYIINTYQARNLLASLDPVMGEVPVLYFRRGMFLGRSGMMDRMLPDPNNNKTMHVLGKMTPRLTAMWEYGARNLDEVAQLAAQHLLEFLNDGNFQHLEIAKKQKK